MSHLSSSQVQMYLRCGEQYRRRYIEGEKLPPGVALLRGSGVHAGAHYNFSQKIESHQDLSVSEIIDYSVSAFDDRIGRDGVLLNPDEKKKGKQRVIGDERDRVVRLADLFGNQLAPQIQPELTESEITVHFPEQGFDMLGVLDLITDERRVRDLKTGKRKKPEGSQHRDFQLTTYAALYYGLRQEMPRSLQFDVLVDRKVPEIQFLPTERTPDDFQAWFRTVQEIWKSIQSGNFPPADKTNWMCSPKWCGYYFTCPYISASERARNA